MSLSTAHNFMQFGQSSSSKQNICVRCHSFQIYINIKPQRLPIGIRNAFKILLRHIRSGKIECLTTGFRSLIRTTSSLSKDFKSCSSPYTRVYRRMCQRCFEGLAQVSENDLRFCAWSKLQQARAEEVGILGIRCLLLHCIEFLHQL